MPNLRHLLNEIKWTRDLCALELWYVHRGAPNNMASLKGSEIITLGRWYVETSTATIPYHRIIKILDGDLVLFDRYSSSPKDKQL